MVRYFQQEQWTVAQQERLELQRARVLEVNRHLAALITSWERGGLPMHMNLAFLSTPSSAQLSQDMMARLKQQNRRLTEVIYFLFLHFYRLFIRNQY